MVFELVEGRLAALEAAAAHCASKAAAGEKTAALEALEDRVAALELRANAFEQCSQDIMQFLQCQQHVNAVLVDQQRMSAELLDALAHASCGGSAAAPMEERACGSVGHAGTSNTMEGHGCERPPLSVEIMPLTEAAPLPAPGLDSGVCEMLPQLRQLSQRLFAGELRQVLEVREMLNPAPMQPRAPRALLPAELGNEVREKRPAPAELRPPSTAAPASTPGASSVLQPNPEGRTTALRSVLRPAYDAAASPS
eukprot:NODE_3012_length_2106_cov_11.542698.p2 GENE.NODE_3012_length_2106_cov_11.542698~~NODE_3012_length_2106_cov_11.542698.p2  ORF type:complete len:253 (+),score=69.52 NODE_3012_length_2106_cov_11.542698:1038-1796(+)